MLHGTFKLLYIATCFYDFMVSFGWYKNLLIGIYSANKCIQYVIWKVSEMNEMFLNYMAAHFQTNSTAEINSLHMYNFTTHF